MLPARSGPPSLTVPIHPLAPSQRWHARRARGARLAFPLLLAACTALPTAGAQVPARDWAHLSREEAAAAGWEIDALRDARAHADTIATDAVVIVVHGKILDAWGAVDQRFNAHSIRKSLLGALCGIRAESGDLPLDATMGHLGIDDGEPALTPTEKRATVRQLLQARSGIYHPAVYETAKMKERRPARHSHDPGEFFYYNNWDFNALGTIYERCARAPIHADFERLIARPIGMQDYTSADGSYVAGEESIHRAYPFRMTARDLARFGLLYLRDGRWGGRQIVPAHWVRESVTSYSDADASGGYGYLWWVSKSGVHLPGVTLPAGSYSARGAGGHYLLNVPALDLVIAHRVNTDLKGRRVEPAQFGELVRRILCARRATADEGAGSPEQLDTLLALLMNRHRVPGVAAVLIDGRRVTLEKYLGVREVGKGDPVRADTIFEAASMTKPLAAYAAMQLVERGELDLDRPLASYLPTPYLAGEPLHEKITARMVLTHTSGFPNWRPKGKPLRVLHEPGSTYLYSGEGFEFLQRAMEQIAGEDYESLMRRALLDPLRMAGSSHVWREEIADRAAAGHGTDGVAKRGRRLYGKPSAAYSLYCTARDYAAFLLEMMNPDRAAAHSIGAASIAAMLTPASPPADQESLTRRGSKGTGPVRFGLGWAIEPTASGPRIRHSGSNGTGFRSYAEFDPATGNGLVILTNGDAGDRLWKDVVAAIDLVTCR